MIKTAVMKNFLVIAVVAAFGAMLTAGCNNSQPELKSSEGRELMAPATIAFIELDSVIANFDMARDKASELETKTRSSEAELTSKSQAFDRDVRDFQNKVQKGLVTRATAAEMEQSLAEQQQTLLARRDEIAYNLNEESMVAQRQILDYINQYLAEFNETHGYQYILARQFGGTVLFGDSSLDITEEVIAGLNARYAASAKNKK